MEEDKKINSHGNNHHQTLAWHSCRKLIYVPRSAQKGHCTGHWPIPEGYWPDITSPSLVNIIYNENFYFCNCIKLLYNSDIVLLASKETVP